jgi:orotate phosphoribosyltransferase
LSELRSAVIALVQQEALMRLNEPVRLASGAWSTEYLDTKKALKAGKNRRLACEAIVELARDEGIEFDAVGGLTLGADGFAYGISVLYGKDSFVVRKAVKEHGTKKRIEGDLGPGVRVLLVDDVVTTGASIFEAFEEVRKTGAEIVLAVTLVDRGDEATARFASEGIRYNPLITYSDLNIPPVHAVPTASVS